MLLQKIHLLLISLLVPTAVAGFYENTPVLELNPTNFDQVVLLTNQTSIVEFYAPWCGHCRQLQPEFVKTGRNLQDMAVVGAVNCDESANKPLCSRYRVEGFPTLIVFRPAKVQLDSDKPMEYAHATEIYSGPRKAKNMVSFVSDRMKNYTKRFATLGKLEEWAANASKRPRVAVLTQKDRLSVFLKSLAIEFLGKVDFAYLPLNSKKVDVLEKFEIDGDSSAVAIYNTTEQSWIKHDGPLTRESLVEFLGQHIDISDIVERREFIQSVMSGQKVGKKNKSKKNKNKAADKKKPKKNHNHDEL